jgi:hypothetical protein
MLPAKVSEMVMPWAVLLRHRLCRPNPNGQFVAVDVHFFADCLLPLLSTVRFDEAWYVQKYPDVRQAIAERRLSTPHDHYLRFGFYENRLPYRIAIDEAWYLRQNEDIRIALQKKLITSAQSHFEDIGFAEGRSPFLDFEFEVQE